jgi:hypothetical protein
MFLPSTTPSSIRFDPRFYLKRENHFVAAMRVNIDCIETAGFLTEETGHAVLLMGNVNEVPKTAENIHGAYLYTMTARCAFVMVNKFNHDLTSLHLKFQRRVATPSYRRAGAEGLPTV